MDTAQEVTDLEIRARQLQAEDRFFDALNALEEALSIQKDMHGVNSVQFTRTCKQVCQTCNVLAVHFLRNDDIEQALKLLRRSEELSQTNQLCRAMTYNNIACYYRRIGKLKTALTYLQRALAIETQLPKVETQADTHLNVCAVLSQQNKHDIALTHAMSAVALLQEEQLKKQFGFNVEQEQYEQEDQQSLSKLQRDRASVLAIAYHNMGVQQEFLKAYDNALLSYRKAVLYAQQNLGQNDSITINLRNVYENARQELRQMGGKLVKKKASTTGYPGQLQGLAAQAAPVYARKELIGYPGVGGNSHHQQIPQQPQHYAYHQSGYKIPPQQYHPGPPQTSDGDADYNDNSNAKQQEEEFDENQQSRINNRQIDDMMTSRDNIGQQMEVGDNQQGQNNQLNHSEENVQEMSENISKT